MIESELVAIGSMNGVLTGKQYNRCIRAHKAMYEALQRLRLDAFRTSIPAEKFAEVKCVALENIANYEDNAKINPADAAVDVAFRSYCEFIEKKSESNPLFAFWSTYIEMVQILLLFIRATRESDWSLHLSALQSMVPWFFATDRVNYARFATCYWLEMCCLERSHPCMYIFSFYCTPSKIYNIVMLC